VTTVQMAQGMRHSVQQMAQGGLQERPFASRESRRDRNRLTGASLIKKGKSKDSRTVEGGKTVMGIAKKVLVVDDEKGMRFLLSEVLQNQGFEVSLARDGQESLDKLAKDRFDLVVTDINMPRLDGVAMLKSMKRTGRNEKVIIMTGDPSDQRLYDTEIPDGVTRLFKPFGIGNFLSVVFSAIGNGANRIGGKQPWEFTL